ncbi:hypothetical protein HOT45_gp61 [Gordonia phage Trine]|uniref:Uncharacterized protein n=1 Tax=Gordonia phage Trine TaxID=2201431 RepID=A0A2Z4Q910_9CAUD|nr:hypothetical protein HOT45_gp61 [Gordonia phage Trine]AWY06562.1 hypothetical protein PBI_TRINE_61 [Gordonia phage Trine]
MAKQMTDDKVREIRERHAFLRDARDLAPDTERDTDRAIDAKVAEEFGVSQVYVKQLVLGISRPTAPGPVDTKRAEAQALYYQEATSLGVTEARRRRQLRARGLEPITAAASTIQRVEIRDATGSVVHRLDVPVGGWTVLTTVPVEAGA